MNNEETLYQAMRRQGIIWRSLLKYCSPAATSLGSGTGMASEIAWTLESKSCIPVVWIHGLERTCCTESFIRSAHPLAKNVIPSLVSPDYDDTLMAAAGTQVEEAFEDIIAQYNGKYTLAVEDSSSLGEQGIFCINNGRPFIEKLKRAAAGTSAIITWGTCAPWGYVQAARSNPTQATSIDKVIASKPITKVLGCLPISDMMSVIITYMVVSDCLPGVGGMGRPLMFYSQRIRDKYYRRAHLDTGESAQSRDDDAARKGYCLHKMGCKGPTAYNACSSTCWNDGVSFPIQSGHDCLDYAENGFQDHGSFYSHVVDIPQMGTHSTADTVGLTTFGVVIAAVGVHAAASIVDRRKHRNQQPTEIEHQPGNGGKQA